MSKDNAEGDNAEEYNKKLGKIVDEFGLDIDDDDMAFLNDDDDDDEEELMKKIKEMNFEFKDKGEKESRDKKDIEADDLMDKIASYYDYYKDAKEDKDSEIYEPALKPVDTPVYLNYKAYKRMVGYAQRYASEKTSMKQWKEVYGILIGEVQEKTLVVIKDAIPLVVGGPTGVELEPMHYVDLSQIDQSIWERSVENEKTDFIVGWWHTHPGFGFFFSEVDTYTHLGYQIPNPFAVGLIFDHCEKKPDFLGVAGLRLSDPNDGLRTDYKLVDLHFDDEIEIIKPKIEKAIKKVSKNMDNVLEQIDYIDDTLRKKALAQLQRNFGLILVPKKNIKVTDDEEEAEEIEEHVYTWDPDFFKKTYRVPKFREKVENEIKKCEIILKDLLEKEYEKKFKERKEKFIIKIRKMIDNPNEKYERLMSHFAERIEIIYPFYDYLDTSERKKIEHFEERTSEYYRILEGINERAKFNLEKK